MRFDARAVSATLIFTLLAAFCVVDVAQGLDESAVQPDSQTVGAIDHELHDALVAARLLDQWIEESGLHPHVATVRVEGSLEFDEIRGDVILEASTYADAHADGLARADGAEQIIVVVDQLLDVARAERTRQTRAAEPLTEDEATVLRKLVQDVKVGTDVAELRGYVSRVERLRAVVSTHVVPVRQGGPNSKAVDHDQPITVTIARLADLRDELRAVQRLALIPGPEAAAARLIAEDLLPELHELRAEGVVAATGHTLVTLDAYVRAGASVDEGCSVDWRLLAGIGRVESLDGSINGSRVGDSGDVRPRVFGPLLDGGATQRAIDEARAAEEAAIRAAEAEAARIEAEERAAFEALYGPLYRGDDVQEDDPSSDEAFEPDPNADGSDAEPAEATADVEEPEGNGFAVVPDTDRGALDGHSGWDRAVGPMQFLPQTWRLFGTDGDGDGIGDPHNLYDAASSAARYLCHLERRNGPDPRLFVRGYNDSSDYVDDVLAIAETLAPVVLDPTESTR